MQTPAGADRARAATKAPAKKGAPSPNKQTPKRRGAKSTPSKSTPSKSTLSKSTPAAASGSGNEQASAAHRRRPGRARPDRLGSPRTGVLVTGGGSGIGRECALALAEVGRAVAIWDVNGEGAEETAALCADRYGVSAEWSVVDVCDSAAVESEVPRVAASLGTLGGFVHAAGVAGAMSVDFVDDELWDTTLNVNLRAAAMISKAVLEPFRAAGPGSAIVLISSIEGLFGSAMLTAYCASKSGVLGAMRSISHRFAMEGFRVNAVCPGAVATPMLAPALAIPGLRQQIEERTPMHRIASPDEIARPIRFLLSDEASFITGAHLTIDGGLTSVTAI